MRKLRIGIVVLGLVTAANQATHADVTYQITDLGSGVAYAINGSGQVVGTSDGNACLWSNGSTQILGPGVADGINASGQIVGYTANSLAFLYANGSMDLLGTLGGPTSYALGINASGQIVGQADTSNGTWDAFLYENGSMLDLGVPGSADAINDAGQIAGQWRGVGAFLYSAGFPQPLGSAGGAGAAINSSGQVVGNFGGGPGGSTAAFLYSNGSMQNLGTLGGGPSYAAGINDNGLIVGQSQTGAGAPAAFLYANSSMYNLNTLIDPTLGWTLQSATAINNAGQVVVNGVNAAGQSHALLLTPTVTTQQVTRTPSTTLTSVFTPVAQQVVVLQPTQVQLTNSDPHQQGLLVYSNGQFATSGTIDRTKPTIVLTHGFSDNPVSRWLQFAQGYPGAGTAVNIVAWNWSCDDGSILNPTSLGQATSRTLNQGEILGQTLATVLGTTYDLPIHFFGHSLGTLVNAQAVNVFDDATHDNSNTQVTLFDDAEIANLVSAAPQYAISTPAVSVNRIDNYVSAFGSLHSGANVANIILQQSSDLILPSTADVYSFHNYPPSWYAMTFPAVGGQTELGYQSAIDNINAPAFPEGQYFIQSPNSLTPLSLSQVSAGEAAADITLRNIAEVPALAVTGSWFWLDPSIVNGVTQLSGAVKAQFASEPSTEIAGPGLAIQILLGQSSGASSQIRLANTSITSATSVPNPSYAWVPIHIPMGVQNMSFDFTYNSVDPADCLFCGINETQLFALEGAYVPDAVTENSGILDVSQWSGQDVELFFGYTGVAPSGSITVADIMFEEVPEPHTLALLGLAIVSCCLRRKIRCLSA